MPLATTRTRWRRSGAGQKRARGAPERREDGHRESLKVLEHVVGAERLLSAIDADVLEAATDERRFERGPIEEEQVLRLELHPALAHPARGPAVEARRRDENRAAGFEDTPDVVEDDDRIARVLDDVAQHAHVERAIGRHGGLDRALANDVGAEPCVGARNRARRVLDAGHVVPAPLGFDEQVAEARAQVEQAFSASRRFAPPEVPLDAVEVSSRRRLFQSREFGLVLVLAGLRTRAKEIVLAVDGGELGVRGLGIAHHQPAAVASDDRHAAVGELVGEMLVPAERAVRQGRSAIRGGHDRDGSIASGRVPNRRPIFRPRRCSTVPGLTPARSETAGRSDA